MISEKGIIGVDEEDEESGRPVIEEGCERMFVDGEVEGIAFDIEGLLLLLLLALMWLAFVVVVIAGEAVEGDDVESTDGEEDEDG